MQIKTETLVGLFVLSAVAIFIYMSLQVGALRFDRSKYSPYILYFSNVSGLNVKADVKIAGVKIGWVESLVLCDTQVQATILVAREYQMYADAHAIVRQDGLLSSRYVEIVPGDSSLSIIPAGGTFLQKQRDPVALDEILFQFKKIAANIEELSQGLKGAFGGPEGAARLQEMVHAFNAAAQQFTAVSARVDALVASQQGNVTSVLHEVQEVAQKINAGQGLIGQLVNDQETSDALRRTVQGIKNYFNKVERIAVIVDSHWESLYGAQNGLHYNCSKGYFNFRIHPSDDYFYLIGVTTSPTGRIRRYEKRRGWRTCKGVALNPETMDLPDWAKLKYAPRTCCAERECDVFLWNLQFGKIYRDMAVRFGLFEGSCGVAVDYDVPLGIDWMRWITTFEAFDFRGRNRFNDSRPHLKWLNKMYFTNHLYFAFGADDFISCNNKNLFFGAGLRFSDDDIKYFLSKFSSAAG